MAVAVVVAAAAAVRAVESSSKLNCMPQHMYTSWAVLSCTLLPVRYLVYMHRHVETAKRSALKLRLEGK